MAALLAPDLADGTGAPASRHAPQGLRHPTIDSDAPRDGMAAAALDAYVDEVRVAHLVALRKTCSVRRYGWGVTRTDVPRAKWV